MIHLLLLIGAAGASSSASIEEKPFGGVAAGASTAIGVGAGSTAEIDAPGRALAAGKCCKRAAKHKRKKLQLKAKWQECEEAAAAPAEGTGAAAGGGQCTQAELDAAVAEAVAPGPVRRRAISTGGWRRQPRTCSRSHSSAVARQAASTETVTQAVHRVRRRRR